MEKQNESQSHKSLAAAKLAFQSEIKSIVKDAEGQTGNQVYDYLTLPALLDYALPILSKHGLLLEQFNADREIYNERSKEDGTGKSHEKVFNKIVIGIRTVLTHVDSKESQENLLYDASEIANIKARGSLITYLRRYSALTMLGLSAEDDDGSGGDQKKPPRTPDPERRPALAQKPADRAPAPRKDPNDEKKTREAAIQKEFNDLGLSAPEVQKALGAVNITTMVAAIAFYKRFNDLEKMMNALNGGNA